MVINKKDFIIPFKRVKELLNGIISITFDNFIIISIIVYKLIAYKLYLLFYNIWIVCCMRFVSGEPDILRLLD